ncbi:hypothetical protein I7I51_02201 [Histoplasma capsulatum]|uniref:Uncharacterized protein n=1 Tax=Ajellomyces capsulatus TaxID=5037 RepID=A0A8A1MCX0_AJECA|nr:predicted protein [Histoplasma mississippiense (nom. inval.)]EDN09780.1 predicted protein [Histoplasma mississippiense (nom. inval.)]QSS62464.1 hypothetical protein I7I51_02201 [Histoplasma capsulatum]
MRGDAGSALRYSVLYSMLDWMRSRALCHYSCIHVSVSTLHRFGVYVCSNQKEETCCQQYCSKAKNTATVKKETDWGILIWKNLASANGRTSIHKVAVCLHCWSMATPYNLQREARAMPF